MDASCWNLGASHRRCSPAVAKWPPKIHSAQHLLYPMLLVVVQVGHLSNRLWRWLGLPLLHLLPVTLHHTHSASTLISTPSPNKLIEEHQIAERKRKQSFQPQREPGWQFATIEQLISMGGQTLECSCLPSSCLKQMWSWPSETNPPKKSLQILWPNDEVWYQDFRPTWC